MNSFLITFITVVFIVVSLFMILVILLQAGKGGGMGSALGGGASQSVFGGGGGADIMARITQGFAAAFMICAMYLAYASAHAGSDFLKDQSEDWEENAKLVDDEGEINYEAVALPGARALRLKKPEDAARERGNAAMSTVPDDVPLELPTQAEGDGGKGDAAPAPTPDPEPVEAPEASADGAKTPDAEGGDGSGPAGEPAPSGEAPN